MACPHCASPTRIRTSEAVSATARQGIIECKNAGCCWRGRYVLSISHTLSPALAPAPGIDLPLSPALCQRAPTHAKRSRD